jgi:hypothetical protein
VAHAAVQTSRVRYFTRALALALLTTGAAGLVDGAPAAWGVVVGVVTVLAVFSFGMAVTHAVASISPALSLLVALLTYALQLVVLILVLLGLERSDALGSTLDRSWIGGTIIVGTLVWSAALVRRDVLYHRSEDVRESSSAPSSGVLRERGPQCE